MDSSAKSRCGSHIVIPPSKPIGWISRSRNNKERSGKTEENPGKIEEDRGRSSKRRGKTEED